MALSWKQIEARVKKAHGSLFFTPSRRVKCYLICEDAKKSWVYAEGRTLAEAFERAWKLKLEREGKRR